MAHFVKVEYGDDVGDGRGAAEVSGLSGAYHHNNVIAEFVCDFFELCYSFVGNCHSYLSLQIKADIAVNAQFKFSTATKILNNSKVNGDMQRSFLFLAGVARGAVRGVFVGRWLSAKMVFCEALRGRMEERTAIMKRIVKGHIICFAGYSDVDSDFFVLVRRDGDLSCDDGGAGVCFECHCCDAGDDFSV